MSCLPPLSAWCLWPAIGLLTACGGPTPVPPVVPVASLASVDGAAAAGALPRAAMPARRLPDGGPPGAHRRGVGAPPPVSWPPVPPVVGDDPGPPPAEVAVSGTEVRVTGATADRPLVVWEFELRAATGEAVPAQAWGGAGMQGAGVAVVGDGRLPDGALRLQPLQALAPGAAYTAYFTGTLQDGTVPVTRSWTFTAEAGG